MTGTAREIRANKARNLRHKKPMLREINLEAIQCWLTEAMEACSEWAWVDAEMRDGGGFGRDKERAFDAALEKLPAESWLR